jgi:ferredoxin-NADP reductase
VTPAADGATGWTVAEVAWVHEGLLRVSIEPSEGPLDPWRAGQFFMRHLDDPAVRPRSYSVASPPGAARVELAIAVHRSGVMGSHWARVRPGDSQRWSGPYGRFGLPAALPARVVVVATGTGIAPFRSMLGDLERASEAGVETWVLHGARRRDELLFAEEFEAAAARSAIRYRTATSREAAGPGRVAGRVQSLLDEVVPEPGTDLFLLCGNPAMVDDVWASLRTAGFAPARVRREKFETVDR